MSKEQSLNELFARLTPLGIEVLSMRNKVNRLEEIFMRLVEKRERQCTEITSAACRARPRHRRPRAVRWIGFQTIVIREYSRIVRIWGQTLVPLGGHRDAVLHDLRQPDRPPRRAHGRLRLHAVHRAGPDHDGGHHNSYGNVVSSFFGAKFGKHVEELLVSPLPNWIIVAGYTAGGAAARLDGRLRGHRGVAVVRAPAGARTSARSSPRRC